MHTESRGFSAAEVLLYLCASRCSLGRLSAALLGLTAVAALTAGIVALLAR